MRSNDQPAQTLTRPAILARALGSESLFVLLALGTSLARGRGAFAMFVSPTSTTWQASIGLVAGSVYGAASAWLLLRAPFFAGARDLLAKIFRTAPVGLADLVWISVAAGIGEEMLFRGAIQPWIGIGWATAIFTLAHAWVPVRGAALAVYVVFVTVAGAGLGLLFAQAGLVAAIVAHAGIDFVVLLVAWRALGAGR